MGSEVEPSSEIHCGGHLVHVHTANSLSEARVIAATLEAEGIPVALNGIEHASMVWDNLIALGGIRISVPSVCVDDAITRLSQQEYDPALWQSSEFWHQWYIHGPFAILGGICGVVFPTWIRPNRRRYMLAFLFVFAAINLLILSAIFFRSVLSEKGDIQLLLLF
jgi:hypothetical protein